MNYSSHWWDTMLVITSKNPKLSFTLMPIFLYKYIIYIRYLGPSFWFSVPETFKNLKKIVLKLIIKTFC